MVDERARLLRSRGRADPEVARLGSQLQPLLETGYQVRRMRTDTSAEDEALAGRLLAAEPVNPPDSTEEADRRFLEDHPVIVLEHPLLPGRPINVVWVALREGVPDRLGEILDPEAPVLDPEAADTAVFYSIWNAEEGLNGLGKGRELIAGAARLLLSELPHLRTLTTLSPIPGFRSWHERSPASHGSPPEGDLARSCADYLTTRGPDGRLVDAVARFHLGNGARLWRLLTDADRSTRGMERAYGMMVNYRYHPENLEANRTALAESAPALGEQVAALVARR